MRCAKNFLTQPRRESLEKWNIFFWGGGKGKVKNLRNDVKYVQLQDEYVEYHGSRSFLSWLA